MQPKPETPHDRPTAVLTFGEQAVLRWSLVFVWLATALVSLWEFEGQSMQLLLAAGMQKSAFASLLILAGAAVDASLGLLMWLRPGRRTYLAALALMLAMTVVATVMAPSLWMHPLGPLTKNIPIAALLLVLARKAP